MKDGKLVQPRFMVPQFAPPNKQWQRKKHMKFSQPLTHNQKEKLQRQKVAQKTQKGQEVHIKFRLETTTKRSP